MYNENEFMHVSTPPESIDLSINHCAECASIYECHHGIPYFDQYLYVGFLVGILVGFLVVGILVGFLVGGGVP